MSNRCFEGGEIMEKVEIVPAVHSEKQPEKGQARRRVNGWTVTWYVFLTVTGILLYKVGAAYALRERGYYAVGGEALALLLPVLYYAAAKIIRDIVAAAKDRR